MRRAGFQSVRLVVSGQVQDFSNPFRGLHSEAVVLPRHRCGDWSAHVAELMEKVKNGQIQPDTLIRSGKDSKWGTADRRKGLMPSKNNKSESTEATSSTASTQAESDARRSADNVPHQ